MTNHELRNIINQIRKQEKVKLGEIAARAGKDRSNLSSLINLKTTKEVTKTMEDDLRMAFPDYFKTDNKNHGGPHKTILAGTEEQLFQKMQMDIGKLKASIDVIFSTLAEVKNRVTGESVGKIIEDLRDTTNRVADRLQEEEKRR